MTYNTIMILGNLLEERKEKVEKNLEVSRRKLDALSKEAEKAELNGESYDFTEMEEWKEMRKHDFDELAIIRHAMDDFYSHDFR